jgi:hypothetical protein
LGAGLVVVTAMDSLDAFLPVRCSIGPLTGTPIDADTDAARPVWDQERRLPNQRLLLLQHAAGRPRIGGNLSQGVRHVVFIEIGVPSAHGPER